MFHKPQILEKNNHRTFDRLDFLVKEELFVRNIVSNLFLILNCLLLLIF